jgi:hypothetical protein
VQQSEVKLQEMSKGLEESVNHLEGELFKGQQEKVLAQEEAKRSVEAER